MKILITLLIALFISSQAYAQETTIKETCTYYEKRISALMDFIISMDKLVTKEISKEDTNLEHMDNYNKQQGKAEDALVKVSKIYHYLNCGKS